jgi:cytochrome c peroxidase
MTARPVLRRLQYVLVLLPVFALAQVPPPPPPLLPLGPPPSPPGNLVTPAKANLGKVLFWDEQLSSSRTVACGSCHRAETGGSDPRSRPGAPGALSPGPDGSFGTPDDVVGSPGVVAASASGAYLPDPVYGLARQVTTRKSQSHINAAYAPNAFWDGRASGVFLDPLSPADTVLRVGAALENQAAGPPVSSVEMGHAGRDWAGVAARVADVSPLALAAFVPPALETWIAGRTYPELFAEAFGSPAITPARILMAIASYERTLVSNQAKIDSVIAGTAVFTPQEQNGFNLFGGLGCAGCHSGSLFSDNAFHFIGVRPQNEDAGRFAVTGNLVDLGAMKTPSLRNAGLRSSYFHNGRFGALEEVVAFYNRGGDFPANNTPPAIRPLLLSPLQQAAIVAFIRNALTDPRVRDRVFPFDRPSLYSEAELVPAVTGVGQVGSGGAVPVPVALEPPLSGNPSFTLGLHGALGGATAVLVIDEQEPPASSAIPATGSFARIVRVLGGAGEGQGWGSATLAIPSDPALIGRRLHGRWYVEDAGAPNGVAWSAAFSFRVFGDHAEGLLDAPPPVRSDLPRALQLAPGRPTPFSSGTLIAYELFTASPVRLVVYDAQGRSVRRLVDGTVQLPGAYSVPWDGRDDSGRALAAGVYFYRLESGRNARTMRTVKLD